MLVWILIIVGSVLIDQISKRLVVAFLMEKGSVDVIPNVLRFTYVENRGAAFGMLSEHRWVFMIVSTLAIAASSLVTTLVIAVGVLLMIPLQPVLEAPALQPAFSNVVPALFGAMAYKYFRRGKKLVAIPMVTMTVLFICVPGLISSVGFLMILSGAIAIAHAWILFRKETGEKKEEEA